MSRIEWMRHSVVARNYSNNGAYEISEFHSTTFTSFARGG